MLTIKNKDKIVNFIIREWFIHKIDEVVLWDLNTKENWPVYMIRLTNYKTNENRDIQLNRERLNGRWYKLSCVRGIKENKELVTRYTINDIDRLLDIIKQIAID